MISSTVSAIVISFSVIKFKIWVQTGTCKWCFFYNALAFFPHITRHHRGLDLIRVIQTHKWTPSALLVHPLCKATKHIRFKFQAFWNIKAAVLHPIKLLQGAKTGSRYLSDTFSNNQNFRKFFFAPFVYSNESHLLSVCNLGGKITFNYYSFRYLTKDRSTHSHSVGFFYDLDTSPIATIFIPIFKPIGIVIGAPPCKKQVNFICILHLNKQQNIIQAGHRELFSLLVA